MGYSPTQMYRYETGNPRGVAWTHDDGIVPDELGGFQADRIVVMDEGEIEEIGPHEELIAGDGTYGDLWAS